MFINRVFLFKQVQTNEPMAFSVVDDSRRTVIARQAFRKQESALLRNTAAQNGVLAPNAQGPVSLETQNATDLAALSRANAAMPARIRNYADAVARLDTIVENLGPIRRHYGHPIVIDSKFILFNARQRLFRYCWVEGGVGRWLVLQFLSSHSNFISGAISSLVNAYNSSGHKTGSTCFFFVFFFVFCFFLYIKSVHGGIFFLSTDAGKRRVGLVGDCAAGFKGRPANTPFRVVYRIVGRKMCLFLVNEFRTTRKPFLFFDFLIFYFYFYYYF